MPTSNDRRRRKRVRLPDSHGNLVISLDGAILDISLSGMAVETNTRLAPQRELSLRLGNGGRVLELTGRVVWCFLHGTRALPSGEQVPVYRAGIQFQNVLSPQAQQLVGFLEAHAIVTLETRLFGRFRIGDSDPVEVSSSAEFRVLELDPSGLTVESALGLEPRTGCEVELLLDDSTLTARTTVIDAQRVATEGGETWRIRLEFVDLADPARAALQRFLGTEPGEG